MLKKFLTGLLLLLLGGTFVGLYATRDVDATHPVLRSSDLAPLIPTRAFYADPNFEGGYQASYDGRYVVFEKATLLGRNIVVQEVAGGREITKFPIGIRELRWHPSENLLRFRKDKDEWEVDPFNADEINWKKTTPVGLYSWVNTHFVTDTKMPRLMLGRTSMRSAKHLYSVSQDGKQIRKIAAGNKDTQYWIVDEKQVPVLRVDSLDPATQRMFKKTGDGWEALSDLKLRDGFGPLSDVKRDGSFMGISSLGRDKAALVSINAQSGQETIVAENPNADIGHASYLTRKREPDIIRMGVDGYERRALTERGKIFLDILSEFPQPVSIGYIAPAASGRFVTTSISSQEKAFRHVLIDLEMRSHVVLSESSFARYNSELVREQLVAFKARDGLSIPAVLRKPAHVKGPVPFIVLIHGGPAGHIGLGYAGEIQFLVNRGYGVLAVNFRGSTGYGKKFLSAGFKQFGRAMQDDITDAANWLVEQNLADPDNLIAMGTSYGGYAAAMAVTQDAGLFDAAIVEFPMMDVEFQSKHYPWFWKSGLNLWWRYFGKIANADDLAMMQKYSPTNRTKHLNAPMLMLAGMKDQITAVQQARNFEEKAKASGKPIESHYFPNAGHGVFHWRNRLKRARLIEDFLAKHAGGRSGGYEFAESAPDFID